MADINVTSNLYEATSLVWEQGIHHNVVTVASKWYATLWAVDVATATQMQIIKSTWEDKSSFLVISADVVTGTLLHRCECTPTEQGQYVTEQGRQPQPVPGYLVDRLRRAMPLPPEGVIYGYRRSGRIVALAHTHHQAHDEPVLHNAMFVLTGEAPPDLHAIRTGRSFLDATKWWRAVERGQLVVLDRAIADSRTSVESQKRRGNYLDILVRCPEPWTGINGPALYCYVGEQPTTLAEAQRATGDDIRSMQAERAEEYGR